MENKNIQISHHDFIKHIIFTTCEELGFLAHEEFAGNGWRADIFVETQNGKFAFEIQLSKQSLKKTLERQDKYLRDGVFGCWFFEKEPAKFYTERIDLPLFRIVSNENEVFVTIKDRETISLKRFLKDFMTGRIRFCKHLKTSKKQNLEIRLIEMQCWKCKQKNLIYYVNHGFYSSCNAEVHREELLWKSDRKEYIPEIQEKVRKFLETNKEIKQKLGEIKERYSKEVGDSYVSFGCSYCDSIFGDWYVQEAIYDTMYGDGIIETFNCEIDLNVPAIMDFPHWCHPRIESFCE